MNLYDCEYYLTHKNRIIARCRKYNQTKSGKVSAAKSSRLQAKNNPIKTKARHAVSNAIRDGRLTKKPCEVCGDIKVEAHHSDYTNKLSVRWLCMTHHREVHHES